MNATPTRQIIDAQKNFVGDLDAFVRSCGVSGFDYSLVAVFGSQSTGKSTLLNALFGCRFGVMDERAREQTTRGIWIAKAKEANILVMDVEGTDGRERGEDQDFERKAALFALASSQVLIVNLWEHQVGLYQGANMGLLKTVFEVNLQLFHKTQNKSLLLFVIRDFVGGTPLDSLSATLSTDIERIWASLSKPPGYEDRKMSDYFDLTFVGIAHKVLMPSEFQISLDSLKTRFASSEFFKPEYHRRIPADGFARFTHDIWDQINANKDLDLPTQQELLAQYRCEEIARVCEEAFGLVIKPVEQECARGRYSPGLGSTMSNAKSRALQDFDADASRYLHHVYTMKRDEFSGTMNARLHVLFTTQLASIHKSSLSAFEDDVEKGIREPNYEFAEIIQIANSTAEEDYAQRAQESIVSDAGWSFVEDFEMLQGEISVRRTKMRQDEISRLIARVDSTIHKTMDDHIASSFRTASQEMWDQILDAFQALLDHMLQDFTQECNVFAASKSEIQSGRNAMSGKSWAVLRGIIDTQLMDANILLHLREKFEAKFRYDDGIPRVWKPSDDIDSVYRAARDDGLAILPLFARIERSDGSEPIAGFSGTEKERVSDSLRTLSQRRQDELADRFKMTADALYVEAKRSTVSSVAQIPLYFYGLLLALGWNELMAVLHSPIYFMFLLFALALAYVVHQLNLWGPIVQLSDTVTRQAVHLGKDRLRDLLHDDAERKETNSTRSQGTLANEVPLTSLEKSEKTD